jgi:hypothetical protein
LDSRQAWHFQFDPSRLLPWSVAAIAPFRDDASSPRLPQAVITEEKLRMAQRPRLGRYGRPCGSARLFADAEALYSYEGTYQMQHLIVGKAVTVFSASV